VTEKLLVNLKEAAATLTVSERTVRYLVARGELAPVVRIGRSVRVPVATLRKYVERLTEDAEARRPA
jgi:excisionase family DNA binding protein